MEKTLSKPCENDSIERCSPSKLLMLEMTVRNMILYGVVPFVMAIRQFFFFFQSITLAGLWPVTAVAGFMPGLLIERLMRINGQGRNRCHKISGH